MPRRWTVRRGTSPSPAVQARRSLERVHGRQCPCCGVTTTAGTPPGSGSHPPTMRTKMHLLSVNCRPYDGDWIYGCLRCNRDQDRLSIVEWHMILTEDDDPRAARVARVVAELRHHGLRVEAVG